MGERMTAAVVRADHAARIDQVRGELQELLLDAIDVADQFASVNRRYRDLQQVLTDVSSEDDLGVVLEATGANLVFRVLDRCKAGT